MRDVVGAVSLLAGLVMLGSSATLVAVSLRFRGGALLAVSTYVIAWAELVISGFALSAIGRFDRPWILASFAVWLVAGLGAWSLSGRLGASLRVRQAWTSARADRAVVVLLGGFGLACAYVLVVTVVTPANDVDALTYHLPRALLWLQAHRIGWIGDTVDLRLDVNPPNAEIAQAVTMSLAESDRYVGIPQLTALVAATVGTYAIARRLRRTSTEALFAAFAFALLPVVTIQGLSAINDLVVAAFLVATVVLLLGDRRVELGLAAVSLGLALGTKFSALFMIPILAVTVMLASARGQWERLAAIVAGIGLGSYWYLLNHRHTGSFDGNLGSEYHQKLDHTAGAVALSLARYFKDFVNLSGARGQSILVYPLVALSMIVAAAVLTRRGDERAAKSTMRASLIVGGAPVVILTLGVAITNAFPGLFVAAAGSFQKGIPTSDAEASLSRFGPVGALLLTTIPLIVIRSRGAAERGLTLFFACAPIIATGALALALTWDPLRTRFMILAAALAAAAIAPLLSNRVFAWSVVALSVSTCALVLLNANGRPSGISLLDPETPPPVWTLPRLEAQLLLLKEGSGERTTIAAIDRGAPRTSTVAIALDDGVRAALSPYAGLRVGRKLVIVTPSSSRVDGDADWLVVLRPISLGACSKLWHVVTATRDGWLAAERSAPGPCSVSRSP